MRTYTEVIAELKSNGITPFDDESLYYIYDDYDEAPLQDEFHNFFSFGQEYLDRKDLDVVFDYARLYYSTNTTLNALARKVKNYHLIEIYKGSIFWMHNFYISKKEKFTHEDLVHFKEITAIRHVQPEFFLFQLSTIYYFYHEVGHLIQRTMDSVDFIEFANHQCQGGEIMIHHMRELDADWHSAHCMAIHIKQFSEINTTEGREINITILLQISSLALAGIYTYFIAQTDRNPTIYYEEKCHPHPSVRLSYMVKFFLDNLQGNVPHPIDQNDILRKAILISKLLMISDDNDIVEKYSKALYSEISEVEAYINKIISNTEAYPFLCKHVFSS